MIAAYLPAAPSGRISKTTFVIPCVHEAEDRGSAVREVDHPTGLHRPAIVDAHDHALVVAQIGHPHEGAEGQAFYAPRSAPCGRRIRHWPYGAPERSCGRRPPGRFGRMALAPEFFQALPAALERCRFLLLGRRQFQCLPGPSREPAHEQAPMKHSLRLF